MARKISVEIVGDSKSLERAFARSSKAGEKFNRGMTSRFNATARSFSTLRAGLVGGGVALALRDTVQVAAEAQQVLGQTSVAVESAGLSWEKYRDQIEKTIDAQSKFGFDDEALLRTFSLFVRGSGDVDEALRRNRIAMDLARARFIDVETAAQLVNKAAMGQAGALRRVGIDARKGASGVALLAQLERQFGGAAKKSSDDAATAMDRLNVQAENAKESLGTLALPVVSNLAIQLGEAAEKAQVLTDRLGGLETRSDRLSLGDLFTLGPNLPDVIRKSFIPPWKWGDEGEKAADAYTLGFNTVLREHLDQINRTFDRLPRTAGAPGGGRRGTTAAERERLARLAAMRIAGVDARLARQLNRLQDLTLRKQLAGLRAAAETIRGRLAVTKDATRRLTLEDQLLDVLREQRSVQEQIGAQVKATNAALKDRADAIKSAVLDRLQQRVTAVTNQRALRDAKERLRIAKMLGGRVGTRLAREGLQDVQFDILRSRIEAAPARLTSGGRFQLGGVVNFYINGVTDPNQVAIKVDEILKKRARRSSNQTRGAAAGTNAGQR